MKNYKLLATMASGLESLTKNELKDLGYAVQTENGRVRFEGTLKTLFLALLMVAGLTDRIKIIVESEKRSLLTNCSNRLKHSLGTS